MKKNPLLKKSKTYVTNMIIFIFLLCLLLALVTVSVLSLLDILVLRDAIIKFIFAFLGFLLPIIKQYYNNLQESMPWETYLAYLIKKEKLSTKSYIRISYAAFLIIEFDGKYLLLKNSHGINLYQLPARTYEIKEIEEVKRLEVQYGAIRDDLIARSYNDYRFLVPINKLRGFYKDFCEKIDPRTHSYQSILDDVVSTCDLDEKLFENSKIIFNKRKINRIAYSRYTDNYEMNVADICLLCANEDQINALRALSAEKNSAFKLSTLKEIKSNGINRETGDLYAEIATNTYDLIYSE